MSLPVEYARKVARLMHSGSLRNLVAQSKAKQVLREVHELPENFPEFTSNLDERITFLAYRLLAVGCSMIEQGDTVNGYKEIQSAADILESAHRTEAEDSQVSGFYCLIGAMAFYACGQYSRAFVLIKGIETATPAAGIIAAFLRKYSRPLIARLNAVLLAEMPEFNDSSQLDDWALTTMLARAISHVFEYSISGLEEHLNEAVEILNDGMIISEAGSNPSFWWLIRLLRLMLSDFKKGSLWKVVPSYFEPEGAIKIRDYVRLLALKTPPVTELWQSQLASLQLALNTENRGGVINLRTSAGKTRVAELAILQTLKADPTAKILYLAPFRSLAFELERTFSDTLSGLGFSISHLYGGNRFSGVDRELVIEANITIATPEKTKAMLRAAPELFNSVKLIVVDEGHLLGTSVRDVRNELFLEHLRLWAQQKGTRILLLSAVLPNAEDLASWVGGDTQALAKSDWKPSAERFGLLYWSKNGVRIEWKGEEPCFNPNFIDFKQLVNGKKKSRRFPESKTEAVAATAVRLAELGPVLIFAGQAQWVPSMTRSVLLALGDNAPLHEWPQTEWNILESVCREELGDDSWELHAAKVGVICHSNKLPPQVRISIEKLMAKYPPRVIVATSTLGQGVNIGISSVIVATTSIGANLRISKRDFWNICGRAGRAFVDGEGKVLFAIDCTRELWQVRKDKDLAESYFDMENIDKVESGLLLIVRYLISIAKQSGVSFDVLLELLTSNNFELFGESENEAQELLNLVDDQLLALHVAYKGSDDITASTDWVDDAFRESLALIQEINKGEEKATITRFLAARANGVLLKVPTSQARKAVIASGLPLSVAITMFTELEIFRGMIDRYLDADSNGHRLENLVQEVENWARENAKVVMENMPEQELLDIVRTQWLSGTPLHKIKENCGKNSSEICTDMYSYKLPWLFHSIAQQLDKLIEENRVEVLSVVGLLVELGLPTESASKVFLAGVRSRAAAVELSAYVTNPSASISQIRSALLNPDTVAALSATASPSTIEWLNMLSADQASTQVSFLQCASFRLDVPDEINVLHVRQANVQDAIYLCSIDTKYKLKVNSTEAMPFCKLANDPKYAFIRDGDVWHQQCRDPRVHLTTV